MREEYKLSRYRENADIKWIKSLFSLVDDDEDAFVPIKCYECGGEKGKCNDAEDLGVEKTCPKETKTCVIARDEGAKNIFLNFS